MREDAERDRDPRSDADAANKLRLIADWAWPPLSDALKACTRDIERGMPLRRVCRRVTELLQLATDIAANPLLALFMAAKVDDNPDEESGRDRISYYIRGRSVPHPGALKAIANALDVKPEDLLPVEAPAASEWLAKGHAETVREEIIPRLESVLRWLRKPRLVYSADVGAPQEPNPAA
jgi:transcriptional regulator with XRE-family HTH domain